MSKKIVFIVVFVECILAVLLISFFGQAIFMAIQKSKVTDVYFVYQTGEKIEDDKPLEVEISDSNLSYQLYWEILPDSATDKTVSFTSNKDDVIVDDTGLVTFFEPTDVVITVHAQDGSNKTDSILLVMKNTGDGGEVEM